MTPGASEESHWWQAFAAGDRRTAEQLVDRTYRQVYAALFKLTGGDADLATDLTQETYRRAWQSLHQFRHQAQLGTWLYRVAYNTFLNHIRRPQPLQPLADAEACALRDPEPDQEELISRREVRERLRRAVIGLPDELRFTVTARFWGDLSVDEIASLEAVTGAAVRKRLKKALGCLRTALAEDAK